MLNSACKDSKFILYTVVKIAFLYILRCALCMVCGHVNAIELHICVIQFICVFFGNRPCVNIFALVMKLGINVRDSS